MVRLAGLGMARMSPFMISPFMDMTLAILSPDQRIPQQCKRYTRALRSKLTIVTEGLAAWEPACARRILTFGFDETT